MAYREMKVVIQHIATLEFLVPGLRWTKNISEAEDFFTSSNALRFLETNPLDDVQILLKFPEAAFDIKLPARSRNNGHRKDR